MEKKAALFFIVLCFVAFYSGIFAAVKTDDELMDVSVKELHFNITPTFRFVLPDTSARIGIKQRLGESTLEGYTEYNYIYSKINYALDYTLPIYVSVTAGLYDNVNFEKVYENRKYLQRNRGYGGEITTPEWFGFLTFKQGMKNEDFYFADLNNVLAVSRGFLLIHNTWVDFAFRENPNEPVDNVLKLGFNIEHNWPYQYSTYDFMFLNLYAEKNIKTGKFANFIIRTEYGYVLEAINVPVWKRYDMGSYDRMMGYGFEEMNGYYKVFGRLKYSDMLFNDLNWELLWIKLSNIEGFAIADGGTAGNLADVECLDRYHFSAGIGIDINVVFRNKIFRNINNSNTFLPIFFVH